MNVYRCHLTLLAPSKEHSHLWLCEMSSQVSGSGMPEEMRVDTLLYVASYSQSFQHTPHKIIAYRKQKTFLILDITFQYVSTVNNSFRLQPVLPFTIRIAPLESNSTFSFFKFNNSPILQPLS